MRFEDILGQGSAIGIIRRAIAGDRVPHAYMFSGPAGIGKFLTARAFAMALNCEQGGGDACGSCLSCRKIMRESHPDVFVVTLEGKKKSIPVDSIRDLERRLANRPHEGKAKVAIIDPADAMTVQAANALLKTLEEPRQNAFIVLISSRTSSMLPTVRSRCQQIRFRALPSETVAQLLEMSGCEPEEAAVTAALSDGSMEQAAAYLSQDLESRIASAFKLVEGSIAPTPKMGLEVAASVTGRRDEALGLLEITMIMLQEILWLKTHPGQENHRVLVSRLGDGIFDLAGNMNIQHVSLFVTEAYRAGQCIRNNNMNPQLALESMLMSMRGRTDCGLTGSGFGI